MDATGQRSLLGLLAVVLLVACAFWLGRCSAPDAAAAPAPTVDEFATTADVQLVDAEVALTLDAWVQSTTTTTVAVQRAASRSVPAASPPSSDRWDQLAQCETGQRWDANDGNGYGGGLQFAHQAGWSTWLSFGGGEFAPNPWDATREQQIVVAERVLDRSGWSAWPGCARAAGWL